MLEYLKLMRPFSGTLTSLMPVLGALAEKQSDLIILIPLFFIGFFSHAYGFVLNDIIDYNIDKHSKEIKDRPLITGTISITQAWGFTIVSIIIAFSIVFCLAEKSNMFQPLLVYGASFLFAVLYDVTNKKFHYADILVCIGIFFLILYGGTTVTGDINKLNPITWIIAGIGTIQVLYLQAITGGLKDVENDFKSNAKTLAIKMGVKIKEVKLIIPTSFKALAYLLQTVDITLALLPFFILKEFTQTKPISLKYLQLLFLIIIGSIMFILSHKLLTIKYFERSRVRKLIGSHYVLNYGLMPIVLMAFNPIIGIIVLIPPLMFIVWNKILFGTILEPKTM